MNEHEYSHIGPDGKVAGEAILFMKSRPPNADGTIGFMVFPHMREWDAWQAYFVSNGMDTRASFMRSRGDSGYMVPCQLPMQFDPTWKYRPAPKEDGPRLSSEMTQEQREFVIKKVLGRFGEAACAAVAEKMRAAE
jgi:hypothetical protein